MTRLIDLTGQRLNYWTVLEKAETPAGKSGRWWLCRCKCGTTRVMPSRYLGSKDFSSCGCKKKEFIRNNHPRRRHDHAKSGSHSRLYRIWTNMLTRCTNSNVASYAFYGGRGITVCDRWQDFTNFLEDMGEPPTDAHTLERKDVNGDYCPDNCCWATRLEQSRNKRSNRMLTFEGKTQCLSIWSEEVGIPTTTLRARLFRYNWPIDKALLTPVRKRK